MDIACYIPVHERVGKIVQKVYYHVSQKCRLGFVFYNLQQFEPIFVLFGEQYHEKNIAS